MIRKIRTLAFGIAHYSSRNLLDIPIAGTDAVVIYSVLEDVLGDSFDAAHSFVAENVTASAFLEYLSSAFKRDDAPNTIFVIYFSGHAQLRESVLELQFSDYAEGGSSGLVSSIELGEAFRRAGRPRILLILDCCFAGAAGAVAVSGDIFSPSNVAVIASSRPFQSSAPKAEGSIFTTACVKAIRYLQQSRTIISARTVYETTRDMLKGTTEQVPQLYLPQGASDLILDEDTPIDHLCENFAKTFVDTLIQSPASDRGALWSAVGECRDRDLIECMEEYLGRDNPEPLWTVRREMGNALAGVKAMHAERQAVCLAALHSPSWMNVAVGLIGLRFEVHPHNMEDFRRVLLSRLPMDARWLAFLYLADMKKELSLDDVSAWVAGLGAHEWALAEIWSRGLLPNIHAIDTLAAMATQLIRQAATDNDRQYIINLIALTRPDVFELLHDVQNAVDIELVADDAIQLITRLPKRGTVAIVGIEKWLLSHLQGVWRGQVVNSPFNILRTLPKDRLSKVVRLCAKLPMVEVRMAVYQGLYGQPHIEGLISGELQWGFDDIHPWVRRAAVRCLVAIREDHNYIIPLLERAGRMQSNRSQYPGRLDLACELMRVGHFLRVPEKTITSCCEGLRNELTEEERSALQWALEADLVPGTL